MKTSTEVKKVRVVLWNIRQTPSLHLNFLRYPHITLSNVAKNVDNLSPVLRLKRMKLAEEAFAKSLNKFL